MDLGCWHLQGFGVWAIQRRSENDLVGVCGFWQGRGWPRELTWWLLPAARGQGIAAEASVAAIGHGYGAFGWQRVETYMDDHNGAARNLVLRLGGQRDRRLTFPDGQHRDVFLLPRPSAAWPRTMLAEPVAPSPPHLAVAPGVGSGNIASSRNPHRRG